MLKNAIRRHFSLSVTALAATLAMQSTGHGQAYKFVTLQSGTDLTQVRDAGTGLAVGYVGNRAFAWALDGSGQKFDLHKPAANAPPGVNLLLSEADGVDNSRRVVGYADRLSLQTVGYGEGAYWPTTSANPIPLAAQSSPRLEASTLLDLDGRWAVGEGHRLSGPNPVGDRAFAFDTVTGARKELLGPGGTGLTYANEITGRTVVGYRDFFVGNTYLQRADVWDLGANHANGDLTGLTVRELNGGGLELSYANGLSDQQNLVVGQGRGTISGNNNHALAWDLTTPDAPPIDLNNRLPATFTMSSAQDARGDLVIGTAVDPTADNGAMNLHAVAWDLSDGGYIDLAKFLPSDINFSSATAITDAGQIVGDFRKADGTKGVFVLNPIIAPLHGLNGLKNGGFVTVIDPFGSDAASVNGSSSAIPRGIGSAEVPEPAMSMVCVIGAMSMFTRRRSPGRC